MFSFFLFLCEREDVLDNITVHPPIYKQVPKGKEIYKALRLLWLLYIFLIRSGLLFFLTIATSIQIHLPSEQGTPNIGKAAGSNARNTTKRIISVE